MKAWIQGIVPWNPKSAGWVKVKVRSMYVYICNNTVIWITFTVSFLLLLIKLSHKTFYMIFYTVEKLYK